MCGSNSISITILDVEAEFGEDSEDVVADAGNNADLYAANQGSTELINEAHTEEAPLRFMGQARSSRCISSSAA